MIEWVLVLVFHWNAYSTGSLAATNVPGFATQAACEVAGRKIVNEMSVRTPRADWTCVEVNRWRK